MNSMVRPRKDNKVEWQISDTVTITSFYARPINWRVTLNSTHKNHNNPSDKGGHSLMR